MHLLFLSYLAHHILDHKIKKSTQLQYIFYMLLYILDAHEAHRLGAVERVVPKDALVSTVLDMAATIAEKSPVMISLAKEALNGVEDGNLEDKYRREQGFTLEAYRHQDSQEARDAFNQKRSAEFDS